MSEDDPIKLLAESERPLSTSEIAEKLNHPRSTTWDALQRIKDNDLIKTWKPSNTRLWDVKGNFGTVELTTVYNITPFQHFIEHGKFPAGISFERRTTMIKEALTDFNWYTTPQENITYEDAKTLASAYNMSLSEFITHSSHNLYEKIHDRKLDDIPKKSNKPQSNP